MKTNFYVIDAFLTVHQAYCYMYYAQLPKKLQGRALF
jgi:hypothetical protein